MDAAFANNVVEDEGAIDEVPGSFLQRDERSVGGERLVAEVPFRIWDLKL